MADSRTLMVLPVVVMLAGLGACKREPPDPRGLRPGETLLSVAATGKAEATPDQALFNAGLSSIAPTARGAGGRNAEVMNRITRALATLGVPARDIQTRDISLNRVDYGPNRGRYEASNSVAVRVRDLRRVGEAIALVTDAGANIVSGPSLSVADPEKASLGAYGKAYRSARAKAEAYAAAANLRIVRVLSIRDGGEGATMAPMGDLARRSDMMEAPAAPPVMAGTNASEVTANVEFVLTSR